MQHRKLQGSILNLHLHVLDHPPTHFRVKKVAAVSSGGCVA